MKTIDGDILDIHDGVVCHQVNCQRVAGAGLALSIRKMYPAWYEHFINVPPHMGDIDMFWVSRHLRIASLFAQNRYGRIGVFTDYPAFDCCLGSLKLEVGKTSVYFPHGIGCGLAGGDWDIIEPMIAKHFPDAIIVQLKPRGCEGQKGIEGVKGAEGVVIRGGDYEVDARGDWRCKKV